MRFLATLIRMLGLAGVAVAAAAILLALALIGYSVAMRYFLGDPVPWVDELVGYLLVVAVMLAAGDALRHGEHISVDILVERVGPRVRRGVGVLGLLAVAVVAAILVSEGWEMVAFARATGLRSNGYLAAPMWIPQLAIPVGAGLLLLAAVAALIGMLRGRDEHKDDVKSPERDSDRQGSA